MAEFALDYFQFKLGKGKNTKNQMKAMALAVMEAAEDPKNEYHDFCLLFAQMCGFYTPSGRISPLSHSCSSFILGHLDEVRKLLTKTSRKQLGLDEIQDEEGAEGEADPAKASKPSKRNSKPSKNAASIAKKKQGAKTKVGAVNAIKGGIDARTKVSALIPSSRKITLEDALVVCNRL